MSNKVWILGPCSIENEELYFSTYEKLASFMGDRDWYYKASFDKANRTSLTGGRGPGLEKSIEIFEDLKDKHPEAKLLTDVHETWQVEKLAHVIDCVQIPAFLCRQTDLIVECAKSFSKVNIKKGQWIGPNNLIKSVDKVKNVNPECEAWICDRGTNFGYNDLFVNFGIVDELKKHYDKVLIDCTHSIQRSRAIYGTQGDRRLAERYLLSSDVFGYDGVFAEVHPDPPSAVSDGDCQIYLDKIEGLIRRSETISRVVAEKDRAREE
tara:strand:- start:9987 stop:10784 length:798 start_codon:yes stop_codon:yes gene_type:complete